MKFKNEQHKDKYLEFINRNGGKADVYSQPLFYLLSLHSSLVRNIDNLYDFDKKEILFNGLNGGFQTSGSLKVTRLAFNLFSDCAPAPNENEEYIPDSENYSPVNIFSCEDFPYMIEAMMLRFAY